MSERFNIDGNIDPEAVDIMKRINGELRSGDYYGEWLDHIKGLYYGAVDEEDRNRITDEAKVFIADNKHTDKEGVMERVQAYKDFLDKINSEENE